jgi:hypothetical protein
MLDKFDLMNDLRAAVIRMNIEMVQVNTIVLALRHDLITCAQAFEWLETGGLLQYLSAEVGSWPSFGTIKSKLSWDPERFEKVKGALECAGAMLPHLSDLFAEFDNKVLCLCPAATCISGIALLCFAGRSFKSMKYARLQRWSARLSIADYEANRIVEVTNDDVALQRQRRIKSEFWHCA